MISSSHLSLSQTGLVSLLLVLITLIGRCEAQSNFVVSIVPISLIVSVIVCFCCCVCIACVCHAKQRRSNASKLPGETPRTTAYTEQAPYHSQPAYVHGQLQDYTPPSTRVLYPPQEEQDSSQTETGTSEPAVPLPDATLHEGDAPPGYEEAIRMTACNEPEQ